MSRNIEQKQDGQASTHAGPPSGTDDDETDILLCVQRHGIRSPFNWHSIKSAFIFWPTKCSACSKTIYPFSSAVVCIRCKVTFHRGICMRDSKMRCGMDNSSGNTTNNTTAVGELASTANQGTDEVKAVDAAPSVGTLPVLEPPVAESSLMPVVESDKEAGGTEMGIDIGKDVVSPAVVTTVANEPQKAADKGADNGADKGADKGEAEGERAVTISTTWRSKARSLASINLKRLEKCPPFLTLDGSTSQQDDDARTKKVQAFVHSVLADSSSFPSKVGTALHATFTNMKFRTNVDTIVNTRECLDAVTTSFISALPDDRPVTGRLEGVIAEAVDQYMLQLSRRSMYSKAYAAAVALTDDQDHALVAALTLMADADPDPGHGHGHGPSYGTDSSRSTEARAALRRVADCLSPRDKLAQLHAAVSLLVTPDRSQVKTPDHSQHNPQDSPQVNPQDSSQVNPQDDSLDRSQVHTGDNSRGRADSSGGAADAADAAERTADGADVSGRKDDDGKDDGKDVGNNRAGKEGKEDNEGEEGRSCPTAVGADDLIERLVRLLCDVTAETTRAGTDTVTKAKRASSTATTSTTITAGAKAADPSRSAAHPIRWFAECAYISHMTRPDGDWTLGAEGYAFTTLQQALQSCVASHTQHTQHTPTHTDTNTDAHTDTPAHATSS
jgi:hypothetical protein